MKTISLSRTAMRMNTIEPGLVDANDLLAVVYRYDRWSDQDPLSAARLHGAKEPILSGSYTFGDVREIADYFSSVRPLSAAEQSDIETKILTRAAAFGRP